MYAHVIRGSTALAWVISNPDVSTAIFGASSVAQVRVAPDIISRQEAIDSLAWSRLNLQKAFREHTRSLQAHQIQIGVSTARRLLIGLFGPTGKGQPEGAGGPAAAHSGDYEEHR